jgi:hypothetical protein
MQHQGFKRFCDCEVGFEKACFRNLLITVVVGWLDKTLPPNHQPTRSIDGFGQAR